jgi:hypothetical protein
MRDDHGSLDPERTRLAEARERRVAWHRWGPYLPERQWGTVREDYSTDGSAWEYFPHDHARSRAYRWNEDGLLGLSDEHGLLCFAIALWNEADPILKERLFGLTGHEGNHGEDVKEYYFYLDATPTHSYMQALYKYPQRAFPYAELVAENQRRSRADPEYELIDTGVFAEDRYFDTFVEYAKNAPDDILIRLTVVNRGPDRAPLHVLPTLWFRNTWSWGRDDRRPVLEAVMEGEHALVHARHPRIGEYWFAAGGTPKLLVTENESNAERIWGAPNQSRYVRDGINDYVVHGLPTINPERVGTKVAAQFRVELAPQASWTQLLRLSRRRHPAPFEGGDALVETRRSEGDRFYESLVQEGTPDDLRRIQRQAFAGLLWSKKHYHFDVEQWLDGDPGQPPPSAGRKLGRNRDWRHLNNDEIISMPDTWEYPWYAAWDLSFHCIPLALVDPEFAKQQLILLLREWYMHPNGQLPAYEWDFGDVNPPVHAWAAWRVYTIERQLTGRGDLGFLERVFHKLLLNFTWWVNRKDVGGRNVFQGGFLGLDNIGVFDRNATLPTGGHLDQSDGTAWMGMYCVSMLVIALELAQENRAYEDVATKFFEHFLYIAAALNNLGGQGIALWDEQDEFYYDCLHLPDDTVVPLKVRSMVGIIPLLAVETIEPSLLARLPGFRRRMRWFLVHRPDLASLVARWEEPQEGERRLLALVRGHRLKRVLARMLDPNEFLSDYGIRSVSRYHAHSPYTLRVGGTDHRVDYQPAESTIPLFGGNSNWRGPIWFPINYLLIESIQKFHHYYGDDFVVEHPTGSGTYVNLGELAGDLAQRLIAIFARDASGRRAVFGDNAFMQHDPNWSDYIPFHEYFHGDTGAGLGASHQTGWTALVAKLLEEMRFVDPHRAPR